MLTATARKAWTAVSCGLESAPTLLLACGTFAAVGVLLLRGSAPSTPAALWQRAAALAGARRDIRVYDEAYLPSLERLPKPMPHCIAERAKLQSSAELAVRYSFLPKLAVVMSTTTDHVSPDRLAAAHNVESWAIRHGYLFYNNVMNPQDFASEDFFMTRWRSIQQRFWGRSQWVLGIDANTMAANLSRSLDAFLELPQDVVVTVRDDKEVTASAVLLRSTLFSWCFLDYWLGLNWHGENRDNGALLMAVMNVVDPFLEPRGLAQQCFQRMTPYRDGFIACFHRLFHVPLLDVERHLPMKALFPFSGFWREHQGAYVPPDATPALIRFTHSCWSTDVLLHGSHNFLGMGETLWPVEARRNWTALDTVPQPSCTWLTAEQELETAAECCLWHYPGCTVANGTNACRTAEHCAQSDWGASGAGLRHCVNCCTDVFG